jgi:hypothetical protein
MCEGLSTCDGAGACKKADGQACVAATECGGNSCVRGACCSAGFCWPFYAFTTTWGTGDYDRVGSLSAVNDGGYVVAGAYQTATQSDNIAIHRYDAAGTLMWAKLYGAVGYEGVLASTVLSDRSVLVGGTFTSKSLDLDPGATTTDVVTAPAGVSGGCFLSKFDAAGNYLWSRTWFGTSDCEIYGLAAAADDSFYVSLLRKGDMDLDPTAGTDPQPWTAGGPEGAIIKLTKDGAYLWGRVVPMERYNRLAVAPDGSVLYTDGFSTPTDLDPTAGADMRTPQGGRDAVVMKLGADGSYKWSRVFAGSGGAGGEDVQVGADGSIVVLGEFTGVATFDPAGTVTKTAVDWTDMFVTKLDANGTHQWTHALGGTGFNYSGKIAFTLAGDIVISGVYADPFDLDPGPGVVLPTKPVAREYVFALGLSPAGAYLWSRLLPGSPSFGAVEATILKDGGLAIGSTFSGSQDFDPGVGGDDKTAVSYDDVFVTKLKL